MRTQGFCALAPQPVGPSGQLGKEQTLEDAEDFFSLYGVGFGRSDSAPHAGTSSVAPWPSPEVGVEARHLVRVTPVCPQTLTPWSDLSFLRGVHLEQVSRHAVVYTDASTTGWGAMFNGLAVSGVWTGPQLHWHINCLELLTVHLALNCLKRRLRGKHVLVRMDNTATVAYISRQGGLRSHRMSQLARHLLLWSQKHLRSLRATHIPGLLNRTANEMSRAVPPGSGDSIPRRSADLETFWTCTGRHVCIPRDFSFPVVLLPVRGNTRHRCTGTQLAAGPAQVCFKSSEPSRTDTVQDQGG